MLSSPRLAALVQPFGSPLPLRLWMSQRETIQVPILGSLGMGVQVLRSVSGIWLEIAATTLFLTQVGLWGFSWILGAIALLHLSRQLLTQVFSLRFPALPWLLAIALLPTALGTDTVWQLGLIQLSALLLRQHRIQAQSSTLGGLALSELSGLGAALTFFGGWPLLTRMGFDLPQLLSFSSLVLVLSLVLSRLLLWPRSRAWASAEEDRGPGSSRLSSSSERQDSFVNVRLRQFGWVFLTVYALLQILAGLTEIQFLSQVLHPAIDPTTINSGFGLGPEVNAIAIALSWLFIITSGVGLLLQWLLHHNVFARHGAFVTLGVLPSVLLGWNLLGLGGWLPLEHGLVLLFAPSLCRIWWVTFQADAQKKLLSLLPSSTQRQLQRQLALGESCGWALTAGLLWLGVNLAAENLLGLTLVMVAILLLGAVTILRPRYVRLLIATVAEGSLRSPIATVDPLSRQPHADPLLTRAIIQALKASLRSPVQLVPAQQSIQLLAQVNLTRACAVLMPLLPSLPEELQLVSLTVLQQQPNPAHEVSLRHLMTPASKPEVYSAALRYLLQIAPPRSAASLLRYLKSDVKIQIRAVAAAYMLAHGDATTQRSAGLAFVHMLNHESELDRLVGAEALRDAGNLERLRQYIAPLIEDFSAPVRHAVLQAIAQTRSRSLYDLLLQALHSPLTQADVHEVLQGMGMDAVTLLQYHLKQPDISSEIRQKTWEALAQLNLDSPEAQQAARDALALELANTSGKARQQLLTLLLQQPNRSGIEAVQRLFGKKTGLMALLKEELWLLGHLYSALVDFKPKNLPPCAESRVFCDALIEQQRNVGERVLLLLQFLYPGRTMAVAVKRLRDRRTIPQGLALLERRLDPEIKPRILAVFDAQSASKKLVQLKRWVAYEPLPGQQRLRSLLDLKPGLEDWPRACAYHLASQRHWRISDEQLLDGLNHADPAVKDAANTYLGQVSSGTLNRLLPRS